MQSHDPKKKPAGDSPQQAASPGTPETGAPPRYEKPRIRIYAPLHEMTFLSGFGATGVGVITAVSGGGH